MLAAERKNIILNRLQSEASVQVSDLSAEFGVSEETIRRDLEKLEREGYATRIYGGATLNKQSKKAPPYAVRKLTNVQEKQKVAQLVAGMIHDGDYLMLDESSTGIYVIRAISHLKNITIITNSLEIPQEFAQNDTWKILCTGGTLRSDVMALTGAQAERFVREYHVRLAIISCRGLTLGQGLSDSSEYIAGVKRAMMASADETVLAVDSRKFDRSGFISLAALEEVDILATDTRPAPQWEEALEKAGVTLLY